MRIVLNGQSREVAVARLDRVLEELGFHGTKVAKAVNGPFVAPSRSGETALGEADRVAAIAPMQGGCDARLLWCCTGQPAAAGHCALSLYRRSVSSGKGVSLRVDLGGRRM